MIIEVAETLEKDFDEMLNLGMQSYIDGQMRSRGISQEQAKELSDRQHKELLPDGFYTKNQKFYTAFADGDKAGFAWIELREEHGKKTAWGFDIFVKEKFRRQGIAKQIFEELGPKLKDLGVHDIRFQVFADNFRAIPLYEQMGFKATNIIMRKDL